MKKYIFGTVFSFGLLVSPMFAQAASLTNTQIQAILTLLNAFGADQATINSVETALNGGAPITGGTKWCHNFNSDLTIGNSGNDVSALNQALSSSGIDTTGNTSFFTENNAGDVVSFQAKYGIRQTGYVGPLTRGKLNALYGCHNGQQPTQTVTSTMTPVTTQATPTTNPQSTTPATTPQSTIQSAPTITTYSDTNRPGLVYPVGGEVWEAGQTYTIKWTGNVTQLTLIPAKADGSYDRTTYQPEEDIISYSPSSSGNSSGALSWAVPASIKPGLYVIHIANMYGSLDSKVFTIGQKNVLSIISPANNANLEMGKTYSVSWTGPEQQIVMKPINSSGGTDSSRQEIIIASSSQTPIYNAYVTYTVNPPAAPGLYSIVATSDAFNLESKVVVNIVQPLTSSVPVENDEIIKNNINTAQVQAEIYYSSHKSSFIGVCSDAVVSSALANAWNANGHLATVCGSIATAYAIESPLFSDRTKYWCADSTGFRGKVSSSLGSSVICPIQ